MHDVIYTNEIDQCTYLRALKVLNVAIETCSDIPGWMDDCLCQRRLLEYKEMLLVSCNDEYVLTLQPECLRLIVFVSTTRLDMI